MTPEERNINEDLRKLAVAFFNELEFLDPYNVGSPMLDCKRPFGNSGYEADILEIIDWEPEDTEEGDEDNKVYSSGQYEYARNLYTEKLTPFLKKHGYDYFTHLKL